jgi:copper(I)-binding protein
MRRPRLLGLSLGWMAAALVLSSPDAMAEPVSLGDLTITDAWARASAGRAPAGAAFMTIENAGADDRLIAGDADVSETVELHTHVRDGEVMRMRQVEAIDLPAGETTLLQPGGLHVMFIGLHAPLKEGESFPLTLSFEQAGEVTVTVTVKGVGAMPMMGQGHGQGHGAGAGMPD